jgi:hypothetical protein
MSCFFINCLSAMSSIKENLQRAYTLAPLREREWPVDVVPFFLLTLLTLPTEALETTTAGEPREFDPIRFNRCK